MQLTKDDFITDKSIFRIVGISFSKFQQVVAFYEKYKDDPNQFEKDFTDLVKGKQHILWTNIHNYDTADERYNDYNDWLFSYCFKDGLR